MLSTCSRPRKKFGAVSHTAGSCSLLNFSANQGASWGLLIKKTARSENTRDTVPLNGIRKINHLLLACDMQTDHYDQILAQQDWTIKAAKWDIFLCNNFLFEKTFWLRQTYNLKSIKLFDFFFKWRHFSQKTVPSYVNSHTPKTCFLIYCKFCRLQSLWLVLFRMIKSSKLAKDVLY
jgi:hypothetical protein